MRYFEGLYLFSPTALLPADDNILTGLALALALTILVHWQVAQVRHQCHLGARTACISFPTEIDQAVGIQEHVDIKEARLT